MSDLNCIRPTSDAQWSSYYTLRYEQLRKPWGKPPGSERDECDADPQAFRASHWMIVERQQPDRALAVARLQYPSEEEAQIRYMAVLSEYQRRGLGRLLLHQLEREAAQHGTRRVFLQAREVALPFYRACGYVVIQPSYVLFDTIQHYAMQKEL